MLGQSGRVGWSGRLATLGALPADLLPEVLDELNQLVGRRGLEMSVRMSKDPPGQMEVHVKPIKGWQGGNDSPGTPSPAPGHQTMAHGAWEVQLRIPLIPGHLDCLDDLLDELATRLVGDGEYCDDFEEEGDEICYYLYGPDTERLLVIVRQAAAGFELPPGSYLMTKLSGPHGDDAEERLDL